MIVACSLCERPVEDDDAPYDELSIEALGLAACSRLLPCLSGDAKCAKPVQFHRRKGRQVDRTGGARRVFQCMIIVWPH